MATTVLRRTSSYSKKLEKPAEIKQETGIDIISKSKKAELTLIKKYDCSKLLPTKKQAWFMIDVSWITQWAAYINSKDPSVLRPKELTSEKLLDSKGHVKPNLTLGKDYRAVSPIVYSLYKELYGTLDKIPLCRWSPDLRSEKVSFADLEKLIKDTEKESHVLLKALRKVTHMKIE